MVRTRRFVVLFAIAMLLLYLPSAGARAEEIRDVFVVNLPETQEVTGSVSVDGPIPQTKLLRIDELVVSPVNLDDTTALVPGGTLVSAGFVSVVLSLAGQIKADRFSPGEVGAILVPDEDPIVTAFEEDGQILLALQVAAPASGGRGSYFSSEQVASRLAFPRYRVYFYNSTDRPASVTLFAYLAN